MPNPESEDKLIQIESYEQHMTPLYSEVRQRILGELALTGDDPDNLRNRDKEERANVSMVLDLLEEVPLPREEGGSRANDWYISKFFNIWDPSLIPLIQSSTIWIPTSNDYREAAYQPFYVIGDTKVNDPTTRTLLIADASTSKKNDFFKKPGVYKLDLASYTSKRQAKKFFDQYDSLSHLAVSQDPSTLTNMYNRATGTYILDAKSPNSFRHERLFSATLDRKKFLSFAEMDEYNVYDHFSELAARFDVSDTFAGIISERFDGDKT